MSHRAIVGIVFVCAVCALGVILLAFRPGRDNLAPTSVTNKIKIAATIFPVADIVRNIGGDRVDVVTILPPGASPHTFDPSPASVREVSGSKILFKIGLGLDDWSQKIADVDGAVEIVGLSQDISIRKLDDSADPHYWMSLPNGAMMAKTVATALARLDPAHAEEYHNNLTAYRKQIAAADQKIKQSLADLKTRDIATFHDAWYYFAAEYGLNVVATFEPFPGKEPTPEYVANFEKTVRQKHLTVVFSEPQLSSAVIAQAAKDLNVKLDTLDEIGGSSPETDTYVKMVEWNSEQIYRALQTPGLQTP